MSQIEQLLYDDNQAFLFENVKVNAIDEQLYEKRMTKYGSAQSQCEHK